MIASRSSHSISSNGSRPGIVKKRPGVTDAVSSTTTFTTSSCAAAASCTAFLGLLCGRHSRPLDLRLVRRSQVGFLRATERIGDVRPSTGRRRQTAQTTAWRSGKRARILAAGVARPSAQLEVGGGQAARLDAAHHVARAAAATAAARGRRGSGAGSEPSLRCRLSTSIAPPPRCRSSVRRATRRSRAGRVGIRLARIHRRRAVVVPPPPGVGSVVAGGAGSPRLRAWSARWMSSFALE